MTDRIDLNFIRVRRWPWFGLLFLLLSFALASVVAFKWTVALQSNAMLDDTIHRNDEETRRKSAVRLATRTLPDPQVQLRLKSETAITAHLNYPWNRILSEIEQASTNDVALLVLTLDQVGGSVHLEVEARELTDMLGMIDRLNGEATPMWYLANYQTQPQNNPPTIRGHIVKK